jgi:photosystem II stability/assembly factor-like uncharacterized protein
MRAARRLSAGTVFYLLLTALRPPVGQATWIEQDSGTTVDLHSIQFLDAENGYAVGEAGTVLKTSDGGATWTDRSVSTPYAVRDLYMLSPSTGWVATGDPDNSEVSGSIWHTTDGGASWTQQTLTSARARLGISFASPAAGWASGARSGIIDFQATTNGGASWFNQSSPSIFGWTYGIDSISPGLVWSVGVVFFPSASGFIVHTSDGGANWTRQTTATVPFLYAVDFVDSALGFAAGDQGTILATTNGGVAWSAQISGTSSNLKGVAFSSASDGLSCGAGGTIRATADGGQTWNPEATSTSADLNGVFSLDATTGWAVGAGGTLLKRETVSGVPAAASPRPAVVLEGHPNPFGHGSSIEYRLPASSQVSLVVFGPGGRQVAALVDERQTAGSHARFWDGTDQAGRRLPGGVYFLRLQTEHGRPAAARMVIAR